MKLDCQENRSYIISLFPNLSKDPYFKITSPIDPNYNCLAWAVLKNYVWYWPNHNVPYYLDGVKFDWPGGYDPDMSINGLISMYRKHGFEVCDSYEFDLKYVKIALYEDLNGEFTHAARQMRNGVWVSKLGQSFDIQHGTPFSIDGDIYGAATTFMRILFN